MGSEVCRSPGAAYVSTVEAMRAAMSVRVMWIAAALTASVSVGAGSAGPAVSSHYDDEEGVSGADGNPAWVDAYNATLIKVPITTVDSAGRPIGQALINVFDDEGKRLGGDTLSASLTNEEGQGELALQPGRYRVSTQRGGLEASGWVTVGTGEDVPPCGWCSSRCT